MNPETTEKTIVMMSEWMAELLAQRETMRRLILSMALSLTLDELPADERELLEEILEEHPS